MSKNKLADAVKNPSSFLGVFAQSLKEDTPYFAALGRFASEYALAEAGAHLLARHLSGLPDWKARIIFGGMRFGDLTERIRQMMRAENGEDESFKDADDCLSQLDRMADRRQRLVHRFVEYNTDALHVTNMLTAKTMAAVEKDVFTLPDLEAMRADCVVIYTRFIYLRDLRVKDAVEPEMKAYLYGAWRYTPAQPETQKTPPRKGRKSRQRPPAS